MQQAPYPLSHSSRSDGGSWRTWTICERAYSEIPREWQVCFLFPTIRLRRLKRESSLDSRRLRNLINIMQKWNPPQYSHRRKKPTFSTYCAKKVSTPFLEPHSSKSTRYKKKCNSHWKLESNLQKLQRSRSRAKLESSNRVEFFPPESEFGSTVDGKMISFVAYLSLLPTLVASIRVVDTETYTNDSPINFGWLISLRVCVRPNILTPERKDIRSAKQKPTESR